VDQLPEEGEASSDLSNPHVLYRKVIEYVGAADQLATLSQEVPYLHNQDCGSGFNRVCGSGSGSRRAKMTYKIRKNLKFSCFELEVLDVLF